MNIEDIQNILAPYEEYIPYFVGGLVFTFLLTPLIGYILRLAGLIDLSATQMKSGDPKLLSKINKTVALRAGGLAIVIPFICIVILGVNLDKQIAAIIIAVIILTIGGVYDDKYRTGLLAQLIPQLLAAIIVVAAGISIDSIQNPADSSISLRLLTIPFTLGGQGYSFVFPADIITIIWIILIIQGLNWTFGLNALGEGITTIVFLAILLISVKFSTPIAALLAAIMIGNIVGFLPYTIYPAKIFSGSTGTNVYGFLIAILSILGGGKVSTSVIVLIIPLADMLWVMVGRINRRGVKNIFETFSVMTRGDHTHLHHRLLRLGLSVSQVNLIEWIAVGLCAILAFSLADLPKVTIIGVVGVLVLAFFFFISILLRLKERRVKKKELQKPEEPVPGSPETPETRYAY